ncbi:MAG: phosphoribosylformylglycinamidine synthase I [Caldilineaceae bacterium]
MAANTILILHSSGANRDGEAARAVGLGGGTAEIVHINQLRRGERRMEDYAGLLLPGGFSYGDALGAGARLALDLQVYFHDQLHAFVESGRPVLGICNGFQTLVKAGILPGPASEPSPGKLRPSVGTLFPEDPPLPGSLKMGEMARRRVTLTENAGGHFECRWVHLAPNHAARSPLLREVEELIFCPIAHGEGNFQVAGPETLADLEERRLVAFRYVDNCGSPAGGRYPLNPNGSAGDIAGICNDTGNVLGLMPHPEDHVAPIQNPLRRSDRLGLPLFRAFVAQAAH